MTSALDAIPSPPAPFRTPEQYAALVAQAIAQAPKGQRPELPAPASKAECLVLLERAHQEAQKLSQLVDAAFPEAAALPKLDLSKLTLEEKLALGEKQSDELAALAFRIAPLRTLESLDKDLAHDQRSKDCAQAVLQRLASPKRE